MNYDYLQAIFWSLTYVLIITYNIKTKVSGIPPIAIASNFAWETVALINDIFRHNHANVIHIVWFFLDLIIVITYLVCCKPLYFKHKIYLLFGYLAEVILLFFVFTDGGMLLSCFIIDLIMAIEYAIYAFNKKVKFDFLLFMICVAKLFGDLCAWLYYKKFSVIVFIIGIAVLILNVFCVITVAFRARREQSIE